MCDVLVMQVFQNSSKFLDYGLTVTLSEFLVGLLLERYSQGNAREVLHDDVQMIVGLNDVKDLHNIGVVKILKDFNLSSYCFLSWDFFDLALFVGFDGDLLVLRLVDCHSH